MAVKFNCPPSGSNDNVNDTSLFKANNEGDLKARRREVKKIRPFPNPDPSFILAASSD